MNTGNWTLIPDSIPRWLIAAGVAVGLMVPLSASADHEGNGLAEVLVSTVIAYAVIDAAGGFDDKDRRRNDRYRDRHSDQDHRYWENRQRYRARHDHRRHDRRHCNKHRRHHAKHHARHHAKHHARHRYGSGDYHYRRADRRYYAHR